MSLLSHIATLLAKQLWRALPNSRQTIAVEITEEDATPRWHVQVSDGPLTGPMAVRGIRWSDISQEIHGGQDVA